MSAILAGASAGGDSGGRSFGFFMAGSLLGMAVAGGGALALTYLARAHARVPGVDYNSPSGTNAHVSSGVPQSPGGTRVSSRRYKGGDKGGDSREDEGSMRGGNGGGGRAGYPRCLLPS